MKRVYLLTAGTCAAVLVCFIFLRSFLTSRQEGNVLKVGFIYENDESTPYTYNFFLGERALQETYSDRVQTVSRSNVLESDAGAEIRELVLEGCGMIFTNSHSEAFYEVAREFPDVEFCQVSWEPEPPEDLPANYHTFNGENYQCRYVSGIAAGMKLRELIDSGAITPEEALVGYVGSYQIPDVISGYTAFLLGVRAVAPEAVMRVRYTGMWSNYSLERRCARELIDEGCVVLSHHTDTIGAAVACEEAAGEHEVYFVGYNQSMLDDAPTTSLISTGDNWIPYITGAVEAVLADVPIEKYVSGTVHGQSRDMSAGFDLGWVRLFELNTHIAAKGTAKKLDDTVEKLKKGKIVVFRGDYTGTDPEDPEDTCDLRDGYVENKEYSSPSFHYVLDGVVTVE